MADYLILGGGTASGALASRLKEYNPMTSVTLIEAGPDEHDNPLVTGPFAVFGMHESSFEYNYQTVPQKHLNNRVVFNTGGKGAVFPLTMVCGHVVVHLIIISGLNLLATIGGAMRGCCRTFV